MTNHVSQLVSVDFFTVPTIWFEILFVFVVLAHDPRRIPHFNVTAHPTAEWTGQQIVGAFPFDSTPKYLLRDRDRIYGHEFRKQVEVVFSEESLRRALRSYIRYYHASRLHLSLDKDSPDSRAVQSVGKVVAISQVGGLHYRYDRRAA